ncbi:PilZ domain-containing protein [Leptospira semungkisensis]|uniref:PilZ domain-containing protein n=1 Tax=Leptospira semungkisensis TaxID=2484985 RepID=A0A4R9G7J1_9LEPT|nr:PilZ domain-containing protein [Leptospira semungkisensis]TGK07524.1 PilZ domain-containing protein [Leptospira semungkisensis]
MDKRKQIRVIPFPKQPVQLQLMGNGFLEILLAQDVSEGGMAVRVPHKFDGYDIHSSVEMVVSLPGYKPFKAKGKIKHLSASREAEGFFGLQFLQMDIKGKESLLNYVQKLASLRRMAG